VGSTRLNAPVLGRDSDDSGCGVLELGDGERRRRCGLVAADMAATRLRATTGVSQQRQQAAVYQERANKSSKLASAPLRAPRALAKADVGCSRGDAARCAEVADDKRPRVRAVCRYSYPCAESADDGMRLSRLAGEDRCSANDEPQRRRTKQPFLTQQPTALRRTTRVLRE
jgi:hypothetical protein